MSGIPSDPSASVTTKRTFRQNVEKLNTVFTLAHKKYLHPKTGKYGKNENLLIFMDVLKYLYKNFLLLVGQTQIAFESFLMASLKGKELPRDLQTVNLFENLNIVNEPAFVCDGTLHFVKLNVSQRIALESVGFLGPIAGDADYEVTIKIHKTPPGGKTWDFVGEVETIVHAKRGEIFHVYFEKPIVIESNATYTLNEFSYANGYYWLDFILKGPKTQSAHLLTDASEYQDLKAEENIMALYTRHYCNQLTELKFTPC